VRPLPLDNPRWGELSTRMGREGEDVRSALRDLTANPSEMWVFREMWPTICSEGTTYDAAFAAAPYLVAFAEQVPTQEASEYLIVLGLIVTYASTSASDCTRLCAIPSPLQTAIRQLMPKKHPSHQNRRPPRTRCNRERRPPRLGRVSPRVPRLSVS
jgi:hypothetical protein